MGIKTNAPDATFYIWVNCILLRRDEDGLLVVSHLPEKIHTGLSFFEACLEEKVIVVPGEHPGPDETIMLTLSAGLFFDINPKNRRDLSHSPCHHFIRYGLKYFLLTS